MRMQVAVPIVRHTTSANHSTQCSGSFNARSVRVLSRVAAGRELSISWECSLLLLRLVVAEAKSGKSEGRFEQ